jgi:hypothetical protein
MLCFLVKDAQEFVRSTNSARPKLLCGFGKAEAEGFRPRKG